MEKLNMLIFLLVTFLELFPCSQNLISGSVSELTVTPGDNITLYCDCKVSTGVYIVWYRNCSHENQPTLVLSVKELALSFSPEKCSRFNTVKNFSSDSYDLKIMNVTESDEGLYYCGTEEINIQDKKHNAGTFIYRYSNTTTKLTIGQRNPILMVPVVSLILMFTPAVTILVSVFFVVLLFAFDQKSGRKLQNDQKCLKKEGQTKSSQDEDVYVTKVLFQAINRKIHE